MPDEGFLAFEDVHHAVKLFQEEFAVKQTKAQIRAGRESVEVKRLRGELKELQSPAIAQLRVRVTYCSQRKRFGTQGDSSQYMGDEARGSSIQDSHCPDSQDPQRRDFDQVEEASQPRRDEVAG